MTVTGVTVSVVLPSQRADVTDAVYERWVRNERRPTGDRTWSVQPYKTAGADVKGFHGFSCKALNPTVVQHNSEAVGITGSRRLREPLGGVTTDAALTASSETQKLTLRIELV